MPRRSLSLTAVLLLSALLAGAEVPRLPDDPPVLGPAREGTLRGTLSPAHQLDALHAVDRQTGQRFEPVRLDRDTGRFDFRKLPGVRRYDLVLRTADGRQIEGIDLRFVESELLELARLRRKQLDLPERKAPPFLQRDAEAILAFVDKVEDFMDTRRVLYLHGWGDRATVLLELLRTRPFHQSGPAGQSEIVWRVELWYFQKAGGGWEKLPHVERVLRRFRGPPGDLAKLDVSYHPSLSVPVDREGNSEPVAFAIPHRTDPRIGRPGGAKLKLRTTPVVLGIAKSDTLEEE